MGFFEEQAFTGRLREHTSYERDIAFVAIMRMYQRFLSCTNSWLGQGLYYLSGFSHMLLKASLCLVDFCDANMQWKAAAIENLPQCLAVSKWILLIFESKGRKPWGHIPSHTFDYDRVSHKCFVRGSYLKSL